MEKRTDCEHTPQEIRITLPYQVRLAQIIKTPQKRCVSGNSGRKQAYLDTSLGGGPSIGAFGWAISKTVRFGVIARIQAAQMSLIAQTIDAFGARMKPFKAGDSQPQDVGAGSEGIRGCMANRFVSDLSLHRA